MTQQVTGVNTDRFATSGPAVLDFIGRYRNEMDVVFGRGKKVLGFRPTK